MKRTLALLAAALFALLPLHAPVEGAERDAVQALMEQRVAAQPGTGIIGAVIDARGVRIYQAGESGTRRPLDARTLFEIGSVTKTFTATALAEMALAHEVSLNDPVSKYLPAGVRVPSFDGRRITLLDLATQRSGLPRLASNMDANANPADPYANYTPSDLYAFLNSYALTRAPGASYEYSNLGFGLLGLALAHRNGTSYESLMRGGVWRPLGMSDTGTTADNDDASRIAQGHDLYGRTVPAWHFTDASAGAGAIRSDVADLVKYLRAAMGQGSLGAAMRFAEAPRVGAGAGFRIGLAWQTDETYHVIEHEGDTAGYHAIVVMTADRSRGAVMLSNGPQLADIAGRALVADYPRGPEVRTLHLTDAQLDAYTGTYVNPSLGITYLIDREKHELDANIVGQQPLPILASRPDHFFYPDLLAAIQFVRRNGAVVGLVLTQHGLTFPVPKLGADGKPLVPEVTPEYPSVAALDPATLAQYVGRYRFQNLYGMEIAEKNGRVFVNLPGQPPWEIFASAKDDFFMKAADVLLHFNRDAAGRVLSVTFTQNGLAIPYTKE